MHIRKILYHLFSKKEFNNLITFCATFLSEAVSSLRILYLISKIAVQIIPIESFKRHLIN